MNTEDVTLGKLAAASFLFRSLTPYSDSLAELRSATGDRVDLAVEKHRKDLMKWLNAWGCRHLSKGQHHVASQSIWSWYQRKCAALFDEEAALWQLRDQDIEAAADAYGSLKDRIGAWRSRFGHESAVHIGPTAASKVLFAVRPMAMMPWDDAMREHFGCDGRPQSYFEYLKIIRSLTLRIKGLCTTKGFQIEHLPIELERPESTVIELVNEYIWVTVPRETRKRVELPSATILARWADLG